MKDKQLDFQKALSLFEQPLEALQVKAMAIRRSLFGSTFELCSIISAKTGACSEDCAFCAQSVHYQTGIPCGELLPYKQLLEGAVRTREAGIQRYSLVTSGRTPSDKDFDTLIDAYKGINATEDIKLCASHGFLTAEQGRRLAQSGVTRYHHNLETSRRFYSSICGTHGYDERLQTIDNARAAGLSICSGGIFGMGETREDRLEMAFELQRLGADSVPINLLMPIQGTPLEGQKPLPAEEILKTLCIYRLILPKASIRLAGGRLQLKDHMRALLNTGITGMMTGDYLTTTGGTVEEDQALVRSEGFTIG